MRTAEASIAAGLTPAACFSNFPVACNGLQASPISLNNGRLWLSRAEWGHAGFAPATVSRATKQLIGVGFLCALMTAVIIS